jgi:hypothetical protein
MGMGPDRYVSPERDWIMTRDPQVAEYIEKLDSPRRDICEAVPELIFEEIPEVIEEYKWSRPVYSTEAGAICYIQAVKAHVNLGFNRGAELDDPKGLLEGTGKDMRHIKLRSLDDVDCEQLAAYLHNAVALNRGQV